MYKTALVAAAAITAVMATSASAAPLVKGPADTAATTNIDQVRLICNEDGHCWRTRGPRYVRRYDDDSVVVRRSYDYDRPYYRHYDEGPSVGFSFGTGRW
jgi:hypothetical protein